MNYPEEFVKRVKAAYPTFGELHNHLDKGSAIVGRYLDDSSSGQIQPNWIVKQSSLEVIKKAARVLLEKRTLYYDWGKLYDKEFPNKI